jgi:hypothetical protein
VIVEEAVDGGLQIDHGLEDATLETALGEGREEALDGVEPGGRGRREVECPARMARQPFSDLGVLVGASLSRIAWRVLPAGASRSTALRKRMNS